MNRIVIDILGKTKEDFLLAMSEIMYYLHTHDQLEGYTFGVKPTFDWEMTYKERK